MEEMITNFSIVEKETVKCVTKQVNGFGERFSSFPFVVLNLWRVEPRRHAGKVEFKANHLRLVKEAARKREYPLIASNWKNRRWSKSPSQWDDYEDGFRNLRKLSGH
jgi:hypothetical protein